MLAIVYLKLAPFIKTYRKEVKSLRTRMGWVAQVTCMCKLKNTCTISIRRISREKTALGPKHR
jgi:hypothetical protein